MPIYIYGCGGHARSVCGVLKDMDRNVEIVLIDENAQANELILGYRVQKKLEAGQNFNFYAIGDNLFRQRLFEQNNCALISIISKTACIGVDVQIGKGTFIGNFSNVGTSANLGSNCIINTAAIIEHECVIGAHTHVAPNACISGRTIVGENVFIGAGSTIIDKLTICSNVIIGAGSTVIKDITVAGTYVGSPVRKIK